MSWFHADRRAARKRSKVTRWEMRWTHTVLPEHYRSIAGRFKTEQEAKQILLGRYSEQFPVDEVAGEVEHYAFESLTKV